MTHIPPREIEPRPSTQAPESPATFFGGANSVAELERLKLKEKRVGRQRARLEKIAALEEEEMRLQEEIRNRESLVSRE